MPVHIAMKKPQPARWKVGGVPSKWKVLDPESGRLYGYCPTLGAAEKLASDFNGRYKLHLVIERR